MAMAGNDASRVQLMAMAGNDASRVQLELHFK